MRILILSSALEYRSVRLKQNFWTSQISREMLP